MYNVIFRAEALQMMMSYLLSIFSIVCSNAVLDLYIAQCCVSSWISAGWQLSSQQSPAICIAASRGRMAAWQGEALS